MLRLVADILLFGTLIGTILLLLTALAGLFLRVPFVPSDRRAVRALDNLDLSATKNIVDLGSGSGTVLFALRKKYEHIPLTGYELAILPYLYACVKNSLRKSRIDFKLKNFFWDDLTGYDTVFCYLMPETLEKVIKKLQSYDKRFTLISNAFCSNIVKPEQEIPIQGSKTKIFVYKL